MKLKDLNDRLTETLERLRLKALQNKQKKAPVDQDVLHLKELQNADSQIAMYKREIEFLQERNKEGGQLETIKVLGLECAKLVEVEQELSMKAKSLNTKSKAIANQMKKLTENKDHTSKVASIDPDEIND